MDGKIKFRRIGNECSSDVIGLILPIQQIEFGVAVGIEDQPDLHDLDKFYHASGGGFWGAFNEEGLLVGTIALIRYSPEGGAIRKMFVRAPYRGKEYGIASRLLEILLDYCREKGIRDLYLGTVEVLVAARRFYEKNGFEKIEKLALPGAFPRMPVDTIFYHLDIGPVPQVQSFQEVPSASPEK